MSLTINVTIDERRKLGQVVFRDQMLDGGQINSHHEYLTSAISSQSGRNTLW